MCSDAAKGKSEEEKGYNRSIEVQCNIFEADSVFENSRFLVPQLYHMVGGLLMSAYFPACSIGHSDDVYPLLRERNTAALEVVTS